MDPTLVETVLQEQAPVVLPFWAQLFRQLDGYSAILLPLLGLATLRGAFWVVARNRQAGPIAAYLVLTPLPFLIACLATLYCFVQQFAIVGCNFNVERETLQAALAGASTLYHGLLFSLPAYLVTAGGLFWRTLQSEFVTSS